MWFFLAFKLQTRRVTRPSCPSYLPSLTECQISSIHGDITSLTGKGLVGSVSDHLVIRCFLLPFLGGMAFIFWFSSFLLTRWQVPNQKIAVDWKPEKVFAFLPVLTCPFPLLPSAVNHVSRQPGKSKQLSRDWVQSHVRPSFVAQSRESNLTYKEDRAKGNNSKQYTIKRKQTGTPI